MLILKIISCLRERECDINWAFHFSICIIKIAKRMISDYPNLWKLINMVRNHLFSTVAKFSIKLTFRTPWYTHVCVSGGKKLSVIREKGESQNGGNNTKHVNSSENRTFLNYVCWSVGKKCQFFGNIWERTKYDS